MIPTDHPTTRITIAIVIAVFLPNRMSSVPTPKMYWRESLISENTATAAATAVTVSVTSPTCNVSMSTGYITYGLKVNYHNNYNSNKSHNTNLHHYYYY